MRRLFAAALLWLTASHAIGITIPTVPVGNAGNGNDPFTGNLYGSVNYDYRIGTTEVTNAQYAEFLNAKAAASDPLGLYDTIMRSDPRGGIERFVSSGSYLYLTRPNMADKPVNYVSWYDAIRFANWLHNGQGDGDTETGAYTLLGGTPAPSNGESITRNPGATWFLPSEDEWYKAAYHQPAAQGGDSDDYWLYPTGSNTAPAGATANSVGDISNPGMNVANYLLGADWNSLDGNVTTVASAGTSSNSFYGTADQGGNLWEWNESRSFTHSRGTRGGSYANNATQLQSSYMTGGISWEASRQRGFRVATIPEPSTYLLGALALLSLFAFRRRKA